MGDSNSKKEREVDSNVVSELEQMSDQNPFALLEAMTTDQSEAQTTRAEMIAGEQGLTQRTIDSPQHPQEEDEEAEELAATTRQTETQHVDVQSSRQTSVNTTTLSGNTGRVEMGHSVETVATQVMVEHSDRELTDDEQMANRPMAPWVQTSTAQEQATTRIQVQQGIASMTSMDINVQPPSDQDLIRPQPQITINMAEQGLTQNTNIVQQQAEFNSTLETWPEIVHEHATQQMIGQVSDANIEYPTGIRSIVRDHTDQLEESGMGVTRQGNDGVIAGTYTQMRDQREDVIPQLAHATAQDSGPEFEARVGSDTQLSEPIVTRAIAGAIQAMTGQTADINMNTVGETEPLSQLGMDQAVEPNRQTMINKEKQLPATFKAEIIQDAIRQLAEEMEDKPLFDDILAYLQVRPELIRSINTNSLALAKVLIIGLILGNIPFDFAGKITNMDARVEKRIKVNGTIVGCSIRSIEYTTFFDGRGMYGKLIKDKNTNGLQLLLGTIAAIDFGRDRLGSKTRSLLEVQLANLESLEGIKNLMTFRERVKNGSVKMLGFDPRYAATSRDFPLSNVLIARIKDTGITAYSATIDDYRNTLTYRPLRIMKDGQNPDEAMEHARLELAYSIEPSVLDKLRMLLIGLDDYFDDNELWTIEDEKEPLYRVQPDRFKYALSTQCHKAKMSTQVDEAVEPTGVEYKEDSSGDEDIQVEGESYKDRRKRFKKENQQRRAPDKTVVETGLPIEVRSTRYNVMCGPGTLNVEKVTDVLNLQSVAIRGTLATVLLDFSAIMGDNLVDPKIIKLFSNIPLIVIDVANTKLAKKWSLPDIDDFITLAALHGVPCFVVGSERDTSQLNALALDPAGRGHDDLIALELAAVKGAVIISNDRYSEFSDYIDYCAAHNFTTIRINESCPYDSDCQMQRLTRMELKRLNIQTLERGTNGQIKNLLVGVPLVSKLDMRSAKTNRVPITPRMASMINQKTRNPTSAFTMTLPGLIPTIRFRTSIGLGSIHCTSLVFGVQGVGYEASRAPIVGMICASISALPEDSKKNLLVALDVVITESDEGGLRLTRTSKEDGKATMDLTPKEDWRPLIFNADLSIRHPAYKIGSVFKNNANPTRLKARIRNKTSEMDLTTYSIHTTGEMLKKRMCVLVSNNNLTICVMGKELAAKVMLNALKTTIASGEPGDALVLAKRPEDSQLLAPFDASAAKATLQSSGRMGKAYGVSMMGKELADTTGVDVKIYDTPSLLITNEKACAGLLTMAIIATMDKEIKMRPSDDEPAMVVSPLAFKENAIKYIRSVEYQSASVYQTCAASAAGMPDINVGAVDDTQVVDTRNIDPKVAKYLIDNLSPMLIMCLCKVIGDYANMIMYMLQRDEYIHRINLTFAIDCTECCTQIDGAHTITIRFRMPFAHTETILLIKDGKVLFTGLVLPSPTVSLGLHALIKGVSVDFGSEYNDEVVAEFEETAWDITEQVMNKFMEYTSNMGLDVDFFTYYPLLSVMAGTMLPMITILGMDPVDMLVHFISRCADLEGFEPIRRVGDLSPHSVTTSLKEAFKSSGTVSFSPTTSCDAWHQFIELYLSDIEVREKALITAAFIHPVFTNLQSGLAHVKLCYEATYPSKGPMLVRLKQGIELIRPSAVGSKCILRPVRIPINIPGSSIVAVRDDSVDVTTDLFRARLTFTLTSLSVKAKVYEETDEMLHKGFPSLGSKVVVVHVKSKNMGNKRNLLFTQSLSNTFNVVKSMHLNMQEIKTRNLDVVLETCFTTGYNTILITFDQFGPLINGIKNYSFTVQSGMNRVWVLDELAFNKLKYKINSSAATPLATRAEMMRGLALAQDEPSGYTLASKQPIGQERYPDGFKPIEWFNVVAVILCMVAIVAGSIIMIGRYLWSLIKTTKNNETKGLVSTIMKSIIPSRTAITRVIGSAATVAACVVAAFIYIKQ